jgi:hypothetical protein
MQVQHRVPVRIAGLGVPDIGAIGQPDLKISPQHRPPPLTTAPDPARITTSWLQRQNPAIRTGMRRFTRLANAFST